MAITDALRAAGRRLYPTAEITPLNGAATAVGADDILSLTIQEGADSALLPGAVLSAAYALTLNGVRGRWLNVDRLPGATVRLFLNVLDGDAWRTLPLGAFIVSELSADEQRGAMKLTGCDSLAEGLAAAFSDDLTYPAPLGDLWRAAVTQSGYAWTGEVPNGTAIIDRRPDWGEAALRQAMGWIAAAAGCFVRLSRDGALELVPCRRDAEDAALTPDDYMSLTLGHRDFGPVNGLNVTPSGGGDGLSLRDGGVGETLSVSGNPLFIGGAAHLGQLARGMLDQLGGLRLTRADFRWRGDPAVGVGSRLRLMDTRGDARWVTVTRQTLTFQGGFSASCACAVPEAGGSGVPRALTAEGRVNGAALVGTVDGGLLAVGSVSALAIQAGAISAEKLAAGSVTADKLAAGAVSAQSLEAVRAHIHALAADEVTADALYADLATITRAVVSGASIQWADIGTLTAAVADIAQARVAALRADVADIARASLLSADIEWANIAGLTATIADIAQARLGGMTVTTAQISDLRAEIANVIALAARDGRFGFAGVRQLVSDAMILEEGVAGTVTIRNLAATRASFVGATLGELVLAGDDGGYYEVTVSADGGIHTRAVSVTGEEIAAGRTEGGRAIVASGVNVAALDAGDIRAQSAVISRVFAAALSAGQISASEAFLASATIPELYATAVNALGGALTLSAEESIRMMVGEAVRGGSAGARNYLRDSRALLGVRQTALRTARVSVTRATGRWRWHYRRCGAFFAGNYVVHARRCGTFVCGA